MKDDNGIGPEPPIDNRFWLKIIFLKAEKHQKENWKNPAKNMLNQKFLFFIFYFLFF